MLRKEHHKKTWLNYGLDVLCIMLFYDGDDLARIVEKVLSKCRSSENGCKQYINNYEIVRTV